MNEEIFSRDQHNRKLRDLFWTVRRKLSVRVRWMLLAVTLLGITIPSIFFPTQYVLSHSRQLAQAVDNVDPVDNPDEEKIDETNNDNPEDVGSTFAAISSANEQLHTMMGACIQRKNELSEQLAAQNKQLDELENQKADLDNQIADLDTDDEKLTALENQRDQLQTSIDDVNDEIATTQTTLDNGIADCKDAVTTLQARIDGLEADLTDNFNVLLEYELPELD